MNRGIKRSFYVVVILIVACFAVSFLLFTLLYFIPTFHVDRSFYEYTMDNVEKNIEQSLTQIVSIAEYVVYNENVQGTLTDKPQMRADMIREIDNYMEICQYFDDDLFYMGVSGSNGVIYEFMQGTQYLDQTDYFKEVLVEYSGRDVRGEVIFYSDKVPDQEYFAFVMPIFYVKSEKFIYMEKIGNFIIVYSTDAFRRDIRMANSDVVDKIAVADGQGIIRVTSDSYLRGMAAEAGNYDDERVLKYGRLKIYSNYFEQYSGEISKAILIFVMIMVVVVVLSLVAINFWFKYFIISDIDHILGVLRDNQNGYARKRITLKRKNELQDIGRNINYMLDSIDEYMHKVFNGQQKLYEMELQVNKMRFYTLKEQINPHFLYNTLGCIRYLAAENGVQDIAEISESMISLLRYNLKEKDKIPLGNEIAMCKKYIQIINVRYENHVELAFEIQDEVWKAEIVKMMIQPILENSIYHGMRSSDEKLHIRITAVQENGELRVAITDDGVGMEQKKLLELRESLHEEVQEFRHIGLYNVHRRICMEYGEEYGLTIDSVEREGCTVYIRLPFVLDKNRK